jgi:hypothetical protein
MDDDTEVANSFPADNPTNKIAPFAVPRPLRTRPPLVRLLQFLFPYLPSIFSIIIFLLKKLFHPINLKSRQKNLDQI